MAGPKRKALTTDELMRRQEAHPAKRRKPSPPLATELEDADAEMSTGSFGDGEDYEDEIEVQSGRPSRGKEDGPGHSEDEEEEESSEDGESDEEAASSHAPWKSLDAESTLTSRIALKPKSSTSRLPDQQNLKTSPQKNATFASLDISPPLISALSKLAIRAPTEIQLACIPPLLAGEDCIGNAKTGSGKTIAFALPILQKLSMDPYGIYALVLTPTRELAFQISEQFAVLGAHLNIRTAVIVGGMDMMTQALELGRRPHVVIATPGRLVDHLRSSSGEWDLSRVKFLVLDEADRLLTSTFSPELAHLFGVLPRDRQTALFTATWTPSIDAIADATPRPGKQKPFIHKITAGTETVETLQQFYMLVPSQVKESYLYHLLCNPPESTIRLRRAPPESTKPSRTGKSKPKAKSKPKSKSKPGEAEEQEQPPPTMIFCARTRTAAYLTNLLKTLNIRTTALHSRLTQRERLNSLQLFKSCVVPVMVCTDVGARGLDIEDVAMVVNWDLPEEPEEYTHRVGRTARAGRDGVSVSFVGARDEERVHKIENRIKTKLSEMDLPESKVLEKLNAVSTAKRLANMELHDSRFGKREEIQKRKRET